MREFQVHTPATAPADSQPLLANSLKQFGMIPNLHGVLAESPPVLEAYQELTRLFMSTSLSPEEQTVVWMTVNVRHECKYCVPAHTAIAKMSDVSDDLVDSLRAGVPLTDPRLEALRIFTLAVLEKRGGVSESDLDALLNAGFENRHAIEVCLGVTHKVMSNYINRFTSTPLDKAFQLFHWTAPINAAAE